MTGTVTTPSRRSPRKREAILAAALRPIAQTGLHNTPMSAIARAAGVAAGTSYLYFESKEALINALYMELQADRMKAVSEPEDPALPPRDQLWESWSRYARWHLDHPDASNFIQQCEASAILTEETRARQMEIRATGMEKYAAGIKQGLLRDLPVEVFYALYFGPIQVLAQMQEKREIEVTDEILKLTFDGVCRSILLEAA